MESHPVGAAPGLPGGSMHTVIRGYAGHQGLADELTRRGKDIESASQLVTVTLAIGRPSSSMRKR